MTFLAIFTVASVSYQAAIMVALTWVTLYCRFRPWSTEYHEVTLLKLLYLYDPVACERVFLYNYTVGLRHTLSSAAILWPVKNPHATAFHNKMKLWMSLYVLWLLFYLMYLTQRRRPFGFYAAMIPFTLIGITLLVVNVVFAGLFINDLQYTRTERDILAYIAYAEDNIRLMKRFSAPRYGEKPVNTDPEDTTWITLLMAYMSLGGIVQWLLNFWIVKDNYFSGLEAYRRVRTTLQGTIRSNMSQISYAA